LNLRSFEPGIEENLKQIFVGGLGADRNDPFDRQMPLQAKDQFVKRAVISQNVAETGLPATAVLPGTPEVGNPWRFSQKGVNAILVDLSEFVKTDGHGAGSGVVAVRSAAGAGLKKKQPEKAAETENFAEQNHFTLP